jgi:hypothetical protein
VDHHTAPASSIPRRLPHEEARPHSRPPTHRRWKRRVPTVAKTAAKDVRRGVAPVPFASTLQDRGATTTLRSYGQRHELFHDAGLDLADDLGVPSVLFAPAPLIWGSA